RVAQAVPRTSLGEVARAPQTGGCGMRPSSVARLAAAFMARSTVDWPVTRASVRHELTSGFLISVRAAYSASKWIGLAFSVMHENQTLSAGRIVRPNGCS